jgi:ACS family tartrate transporter-like MFS transporter
VADRTARGRAPATRGGTQSHRLGGHVLVYFGLVACNYGVGWLPQIIKPFGLSNAVTGWVTAIPYAVGAAFMMWYGYRSDSRGERKVHTAVSLAIAAVGIAASTLTSNPTFTVIAFAIGACGLFGTLPVFWTLPTAVLSGTAAATSSR